MNDILRNRIMLVGLLSTTMMTTSSVLVRIFVFQKIAVCDKVLSVYLQQRTPRDINFFSGTFACLFFTVGCFYIYLDKEHIFERNRKSAEIVGMMYPNRDQTNYLMLTFSVAGCSVSAFTLIPYLRQLLSC